MPKNCFMDSLEATRMLPYGTFMASVVGMDRYKPQSPSRRSTLRKQSPQIGKSFNIQQSHSNKASCWSKKRNALHLRICSGPTACAASQPESRNYQQDPKGQFSIWKKDMIWGDNIPISWGVSKYQVSGHPLVWGWHRDTVLRWRLSTTDLIEWNAPHFTVNSTQDLKYKDFRWFQYES